MTITDEIRTALIVPSADHRRGRRTLTVQGELAGDLIEWDSPFRRRFVVAWLDEADSGADGFDDLVQASPLHAVVNGLGVMLKEPSLIFGQPQSGSIGQAYKR